MKRSTVIDRRCYDGRRPTADSRQTTDNRRRTVLRPLPIVLRTFMLFSCLLLIPCVVLAQTENALPDVTPAKNPTSEIASTENAVDAATEVVSEAVSSESIADYDFSGLDKTISLDIRGMDIMHFLKFLAIEGNLNIVASNAVSGTVNLLINNVTIGDALEIVLSMNNLAYEVQGNIIKVTTNAEYKALYGVDFYDQREIYITQLKYASPTDVGTILGNVKSEIGKVVYDNSTGTLILIDTPEKIAEMKEIIAQQELPTITRILPTETKVFELNYAKVEDIEDEIEKVLTTDVGTIRSDTRTNTIVVTDMPHKIKEIEKIIKAFDRKTRQVFIEAKVIEATLTDTFQWGIDWDTLMYMTLKGTDNLAQYSFFPEVTLPLSLTGDYFKLTMTKIQGQDLSAVLEALSTVTETKILSNPHLTVEEGKEAKIQVIERQPYEEETTTTASGGTTTTAKTYQWVDVGVVLHVTPTINEEGYINMLIKPEVSSISTWYGGEAQASGAVPVVKTADAETTITVKDGVTIIIAGLIKDEKTKSVYKVPFLGDVPVIGRALFQHISDDIRRTETIIFLTPRIVSGEEPFLLQRDMPKEIKGIRR